MATVFFTCEVRLRNPGALWGGGQSLGMFIYSSLNLRWERCCQIRKTDLTKLKKTQISQLSR